MEAGGGRVDGTGDSADAADGRIADAIGSAEMATAAFSTARRLCGCWAPAVAADPLACRVSSALYMALSG
jgi:hypothetical protein